MSNAVNIKFNSCHFFQQLADFDKIEVLSALCDNRWTWNEAKAEATLRWRSDIVRVGLVRVIDEFLKKAKMADVPKALRKYTADYLETNKEKIVQDFKTKNPGKKVPENIGFHVFSVVDMLVGTWLTDTL